jgi:putative PIN family toxin of toxin-antitoxin system
VKRVLLDATCWVAAAGSPAGGSAAIILLAQAFLLVLVTSRSVLQEAERNIRNKMGDAALERFYLLLDTTEIEISEQTTAEEEQIWAAFTADKDRHVLAAALKAKADVLVTLDRKHVLTEDVRANFPIPVQDTKEFLTQFQA